MKNRDIVHFDLDSFYVSVERLRNPKYNGLPIVIVGSSDRSVVSSCSYEARELGIHSAMPKKALWPVRDKIIMIEPNMDVYTKFSNYVSDIIKRDSPPLVEQASIDEFYIDITGMDKFFGCFKWTSALAKKITKETGLPISFGLSINKTVAKIATTESKPFGKLHVPASKVQEFLNPLPISQIPGVGEEMTSILSAAEIKYVETLAQTPVEIIQALIGKLSGMDIWKKANGIDESPVVPKRERKSLSKAHTFLQDTIDLKMIDTLLIGMVEELAYQLRAESLLTSNIAVKIRYTNFDTNTLQQKIDNTSDDQVLITKTRELFNKLYSKRMKIRLVGIRFTNFVHGNYQINLFVDTPEQVSLRTAIDKSRRKFGFDCIHLCAGLPPKISK